MDSNYIMLHWIAKEVCNSKQMQVLESKQVQASADLSGHNPHLPTQSSDDSLFRMCGAEIARTIRVKTEQLKKGKSGTFHSLRTDTLEKEIQFLKSLCVCNKDKRSLQDSIPKGVQILDLGYLWIPLPSLRPFLVSVDEVFRRHVNNIEFQKHGSHIFEVVTTKFVKERKRILPQFCSCLGCHSLPSTEAHAVYEDLFTKMINLRKEDWKTSNERVQSKKGKRSDVTLMLRDELKPFAVKKERKE